MNEIDRDLINKVLAAAGHAGTKGFDYMVHYQIVDGFTGILGGLMALGVLGLGLWRAFAWKPPKGFDGESAHIVRGVIIGAMCIAVFVIALAIPQSLAQILAPEGAAIKSVIK